MADLLFDLLRANLAAAAMIVLVLAARRQVRGLFGAQLAYGLWVLPLLAAAASLAPPRVVFVAARQAVLSTPVAAEAVRETAEVAGTIAPAAASMISIDPTLAVGLVWLAGVVVSLVAIAIRQQQFLADVRKGRAGPAVAGVLNPKIVVPEDFADLYSPREQAVVLAHEEMHLARHDPRAIALGTALRCLNWFNPLVHVAVYFMRIDQELACDAQVIARDPKIRRAYADAMLKTQLTAVTSLPLGCLWPSASRHPLAERISLLTASRPGRLQRAAGVGLIALSAATSGFAAWAAQPAKVLIAPTPTVLAAPPAPVAPAPAVAVMTPARPALAAVPAPAVEAAQAVATPHEADPAAAAPVTAATAAVPASPATPAAPAFPATPAAAPSEATAELIVAEVQQAVRQARIETVVAQVETPRLIKAATFQTTQIQSGGEQTRSLPFDGGERLSVRVSADVRYVQGPARSVVITGRPEDIEDIVVRGGAIEHNRPWNWKRRYGRILIVVTAPRLTDVSLSGSGRLDLGQLSQDRLDLTLSGSGRATAAGTIRSVNLRVSGSGDARLSGLSTGDMVAGVSGSGDVVASGAANSVRITVSGSGGVDMSGLGINDLEARLSGSGSVRAGPRQSADVRISGSGSMRLLTNPMRSTVSTSGSGRVIRTAAGA